MDLERLKYPVGKPNYPKEIIQNDISNWIRVIERFPTKVEEELSSLSEQEISKFHHRKGGWSIKQVINHCIDSHMNSFIRFKLALTEDKPTIKPYQEDKWAELTDTIDYTIKESLVLLKALHRRWVFLLGSLGEEEFKRTFIHPEGNEEVSLGTNLYLYAWHCENHLGHIKNAKKYQYEK